MELIINNLNQLIEKSENIIEVINNDEPSLELIEDQLEQRESLINELEALSGSYYDEKLNEQSVTGLNHLIHLFEKFSRINEEFQVGLRHLSDNYKSELQLATKQRRAENGYNISQSPDISHL